MSRFLRLIENSKLSFLVNKNIVCLTLILISMPMWTQNFDNFGKAKLVKVNGGISANSVFYEGEANRDPLTYFVSGNVNFNIKGVYNIPLSFSYSNQEFETSRPFTFNRLSLHPSYKWITAHIGDVNMTFSPYTLNGHQFSGVGVDLTPNKPYTLSAMYGRLQKEVEYKAQDSLSFPVYKRVGFGLKASYKFEKFDVAVVGFKASDDLNSISPNVPAELGVTPKDNFVGSVETNINFLKKATIHFELASSVITEDAKASSETQNKTPLSFLVANNATTQSFKAFNVDLSYPVANGSVGASYERIDPDYRTLGAYFFNNDLENITVNASQSILKGKVSIAVNGGLQKDDLNNTKDSQLQRVVSSVNLGYNPNDKLNLTASYSNFNSYTNIKNQFDLINEVAQGDNLDTLDFQQISQNASLGIGYQLKTTKVKTQNVNFNVSMQTSESRQGDKVTENGISNFYNAAGTYNLGFPERTLTIATSANATLNELGTETSITFGPTVAVSKQFFDKKLRTSLSTSYNQSRVDSEKQSEVINIRANAGYVYAKKHNLNLSLLSQARNTQAENTNPDFTATLSYSYAFDNFKVKLPKPTRKEKEEDPSVVRFSYRDSIYEGTKASINSQLRNLQNSVTFREVPPNKKEELTILRSIVAEEKENAKYKEKALVFLDQLYSYNDFKLVYKELIYGAILNLYPQIQRTDYSLEQAYFDATIELKKHPLYPENNKGTQTASKSLKDEYTVLENKMKERKTRLIGHRWMKPIIEKWSKPNALKQPDAMMEAFMDKEKYKVFRMFSNTPETQRLKLYIEGQLIDYYYKLSLKKANQNEVELLYTNKN